VDNHPRLHHPAPILVDNAVVAVNGRDVISVLPEGADELATDPQVLAQAGTNGAADACISGTGAGEKVPSGVLLSAAWAYPR
jgi:hypothetical protein